MKRFVKITDYSFKSDSSATVLENMLQQNWHLTVKSSPTLLWQCWNMKLCFSSPNTTQHWTMGVWEEYQFVKGFSLANPKRCISYPLKLRKFVYSKRVVFQKEFVTTDFVEDSSIARLSQCSRAQVHTYFDNNWQVFIHFPQNWEINGLFVCVLLVCFVCFVCLFVCLCVCWVVCLFFAMDPHSESNLSIPLFFHMANHKNININGLLM